MTQTKTSTDRSVARKVLQTEAAAILALVDRLDESFDRAVRMIHACQGRVIVTGMGKSGIICRKIAATLASTGTSAFFLHPAEATHGDLGVIQPSDLLLAMSHSGETQEVLRLLEAIRRIGAKIVAITGTRPRHSLRRRTSRSTVKYLRRRARSISSPPRARPRLSRWVTRSA